MKHRSMRTVLTVCLLVGTFTMGAAATATVQKITATIRPDITVKVNDETQAMYDKNEERIYPIEYNGSTYLPIRALGNLLGQEVVWDTKAQTVSLYTRTETAPEDLTLDALNKRIAKVENRYTTLYSDMLDTAKAPTYSENLTIYHRLNDRRTDLISALKELQVDAAEAYRLDKMNQAAFKTLKTQLQSMESKLNTMEAELQKKYGVGETLSAEKLREEAKELQWDLTTLDQTVTEVEKAATAKRWKVLDAAAQKAYKSVRNDVSALQIALNESLRQSMITFADYNEIAATADQLDQQCKSLRSRLDQAADNWNDQSGTPNPDMGDKDAEELDNEIGKAQDQADVLFTKCRDFFNDKNRNEADGYALMQQVDALAERIDDMEDAIEDHDKLGRKTAWELLRKLDKADDTLEKAEDFLEKAGLDDDWDDDNDHDRGWHNGKENGREEEDD